MLKQLALAGACTSALSCACPPASAATTAVTSNAAFASALAAAAPGDIITLSNAVTSLGTITGVNKAAPGVTITSADPGNPVSLGDFKISASSNIAFTHLDFSLTGGQADQSGAIKANADTNLTFDSDTFHGPASTIAAAAAHAGPGLLLNIAGSTGVVVTHGAFSGAYRGLNINTDAGVTVTSNRFHDLGSDGVDGQQSGDVEIALNTCTAFWPKAGDHPDCVQFWTARTTAPTHDLNVHDNVVVRGPGGLMQGVFLTDQNLYLGAADATEFSRVTVSHNLIIGSGGNAIDVSGACDVTIAGNQIDPLPGAPAWVRYDHLCGAQTIGANPVATVTDAGAAALAAWSGVNKTPTAASPLDPALSPGAVAAKAPITTTLPTLLPAPTH